MNMNVLENNNKINELTRCKQELNSMHVFVLLREWVSKGNKIKKQRSLLRKRNINNKNCAKQVSWHTTATESAACQLVPLLSFSRYFFFVSWKLIFHPNPSSAFQKSMSRILEQTKKMLKKRMVFAYSPSSFMPTSRHFWKRQNGHRFRCVLSMWHCRSATHW